MNFSDCLQISAWPAYETSAPPPRAGSTRFNWTDNNKAIRNSASRCHVNNAWLLLSNYVGLSHPSCDRHATVATRAKQQPCRHLRSLHHDSRHMDMEPIGAAAGIAQISRSAWKLGSYIYTIYQGTKTIDESVQGLALEVNGLASTCDLVHDELGTVLTKQGSGSTVSRYDRDGRLRRCIDHQVAQCKTTLGELETVVETLWPRKDSFFERASKQVDLQNSREQTTEIRQRIRSHTDALHTILLVVNIRVAHIAPDHATQQLPGKLDDLRQMVKNIESKLDGSHSRSQYLGDDESTLINFARETLRSGKTLYEASVAGSVLGAETADSVMGYQQAASSNKKVAEWVTAVSSLREGHLSDNAPSVFSDDGKDTIATKSTLGGGPLAVLADDVDYDSDDEQVELAQAALDSGNKAFDAEKWVVASKLLHTSLKLLTKLPQKHRRAEGIFELQYRLAVCSYHTGNIEQAEAGLESLSQHTPISDAQGIELCNARHLLSRIYIERNNYHAAKEACDSTLKARSRLLGKQHEARYESMALMSRIYSLLNDDVMSELYAERVPEARRDALLAAVSTLGPSQPSLKNDPEPTSPITISLGASNAHASQSSVLQELGLPSPKHHEGDGSILSLSPDPSPYGVSPKTNDHGVLDSFKENAKSLRRTNTIGHPATPTETSQLWTSIEPNPSRNSEAFAATANESNVDVIPLRPQRWSSAPTIAVSSASSDYRKSSTSTHRKSTISLETHAEDTHLPIQTPAQTERSSGSMSRSDREAIIKRFKIEPMHNLDEAICSGKLDKALTLVNALYSGSKQLDNPDTSIVFSSFSPGLRSATKSPALHLAVLFGDLTLIKPLTKNGFSANFPYQLSFEPGMQETLAPLDIAIASRNEQIILELLAHGALLDPTKGLSPCRQLLAPTSLQLWPPSDVSDVISTLDLLLSHDWLAGRGFARQSTPIAMPTLLHQACSLPPLFAGYRLPVVKFILEQYDTNYISVPALETPLHHAIRLDDSEVVDALLQAQRSFRLRNMLDKRNAQDSQPLYLAVQRAIAKFDLPLTIIRGLLDQGADLDNVHTQYESRRLRTSKKTHSTARSIAMESGREDLVALVKLHKERATLQPLTRARTVSDDGSRRKSALPHIGVSR
jgi:ankyrin repeat protein